MLIFFIFNAQRAIFVLKIALYTMINPELRAYVEQEILPRYRHFDAAHREDHVRTVVEESLRLARFYLLNEEMLYVAAAYHDLGLDQGRERHHLRSGELIAADVRLRRWFSEEQLEVIRQAAEDHRASAEREPRSIYGAIVAEADRVIAVETTLKRTVQYSLKNHPELDLDGHLERCANHLKVKYGEGGYLKLYIPQSDNAARLAELRRLLADDRQLRSRLRAMVLHESKG